MASLGEVLGRVVGEANHLRISFTAIRPPSVGEYVLVEYGDGKYVLGIVEASRIGNPMIGESTLRPEIVEQAASFNAERHEYMMGDVRLLSWLETLINNQEVNAPRYPPHPGARVFKASDDVLKKIFVRSTSQGWIRLGRLANHPSVPFYINIDYVVNRHLAILAAIPFVSVDLFLGINIWASSTTTSTGDGYPSSPPVTT